MNVVFVTRVDGAEGLYDTVCECVGARRAYRQVPELAGCRNKVSSNHTLGIARSVLHGIAVADGPRSRVSEFGSRRRCGSSLPAAQVGQYQSGTGLVDCVRTHLRP